MTALRSGKYAQGKSRLRDGNSYCCLGVACDLVGTGKFHDDGIAYYRNKPHFGLMPPFVASLYGVSVSPWELANANDDGVPFSEIADMIAGMYDNFPDLTDEDRAKIEAEFK